MSQRITVQEYVINREYQGLFSRNIEHSFTRLNRRLNISTGYVRFNVKEYL